MTEAETWTIGKLLKWTEDYLSKLGSTSARLDAEVLLAFARGCQRIELYTAFDEVAPDELRTKFRELVKRRASGTPVAYLVEQREFYSLPFHVSPAVLIPRPETEFLVLRLLDRAKERNASPDDEPLTIVDVGTGSGIVAICAAIYLPRAQVIAIDSSEEALEVARSNATRHNVSDRIDFRCSSLLQDVSEPVDFVVSNPPYVSESEYEALDKSVRDFEPRQALVGGPTGAELIHELIQQTRQALKPQGWLLLELSPMILDSVQSSIDAAEWLGETRVTPDLAKLPRVIEAQRG